MRENARNNSKKSEPVLESFVRRILSYRKDNCSAVKQHFSKYNLFKVK
jgi:hypothetical protein